MNSASATPTSARTRSAGGRASGARPGQSRRRRLATGWRPLGDGHLSGVPRPAAGRSGTGRTDRPGAARAPASRPGRPARTARSARPGLAVSLLSNPELSTTTPACPWPANVGQRRLVDVRHLVRHPVELHDVPHHPERRCLVPRRSVLGSAVVQVVVEQHDVARAAAPASLRPSPGPGWRSSAPPATPGGSSARAKQRRGGQQHDHRARSRPPNRPDAPGDRSARPAPASRRRAAARCRRRSSAGAARRTGRRTRRRSGWRWPPAGSARTRRRARAAAGSGGGSPPRPARPIPSSDIATRYGSVR